MTMNTPKHTARLAAVALFGMLLLSPQAVLSQEAEHPDGSVVSERTINVRDVDLSTTQGARWLYRRIVSAAMTVCWSSVERRGGLQWRNTQASDARRCFDAAVNEAFARVNAATGLNIEQLAGLNRYDEALASR
jgi:UrcA family protein